MASAQEILLRQLPSVDALISNEKGILLVARFGKTHTVAMARAILTETRSKILADPETKTPKNIDEWRSKLESALEKDINRGATKVVNCSGVVVHTNLGRSILAEEAAQAVYDAATANINLEYRIDEGVRGDRDDLVEKLLIDLTGAEAATVVNNNAAAVLLVLNTFSDGKECVVSRGELIEIGGSFRLPEVMGKSGCVIKEIGATNRTHMADYEKGINRETGLIIKAHTSNFKIIGFTSAPKVGDIAAFADKAKIPFVVDLGSGTLIDLAVLGLPHEPTVQNTLNAGAGIVTFSGDKLLGGPQAGVIVGRKDFIKSIKSNHLKRALRCDKMTLVALAATLKLYLNPDEAIKRIPTLKWLGRPVDEIKTVAQAAAIMLTSHFNDSAKVTVIDDVSTAGSGSLPVVEIPTLSVAILHSVKNPNELSRWFRSLNPPIIGRVENDLFRLDMRCVDSAESIAASLAKA